MSRQTFVYRDGLGVVEKHLAPPSSGVFHVIRDGMDAAVHPCTGEMMDSKSAFRRVTREHGCVEVGDQAHTMGRRDVFEEKRATEARKQDIAEAVQNARRGDHGGSFERLGLRSQDRQGWGG